MDSSNSYEWFTSLRYYYYDMWQADGDLRVQRLPFMDGGPWTIIVITCLYVYFVKVLGPRFMAERQPLRIMNLIFWYNICMVMINAFFFVCAIHYTRFGFDCWTCIIIEKHSSKENVPITLILTWLYVISKLVDFLDTIFFVLRKKFSHVTALHVFHHSVMPINCWMGLKYVPSRTAALLLLLNSFVHMLMYTYYALATLGPKLRPYLWWKKYLTLIQIIQIAILCFHMMYIYNLGCNFPLMFAYVTVPQGFLLLGMFCSFFVKAYINWGEKKYN